jgi:hypothetical protein
MVLPSPLSIQHRCFQINPISWVTPHLSNTLASFCNIAQAGGDQGHGVQILSNGAPFYAYWNQIMTASGNDDTENIIHLEGIRFVNRDNEVDRGVRTLFVRKSYRDLAQIILDNTLRNAVLTGTPGVGKTTFRNYLVLRLIKYYREKEEDFSIVLDISPRVEGGVCQVFDVKFINGEMTWTAQTCSNNPFGRAPLLEGNTWLLLDVSQGDSKHRYRNAAHTIMFTSPNESAWKEFLKEDAVLLYLPTWSYGEAVAMSTAIALAENIFEDRWNKYKGIARALFAINDQYDAYELSVQSSLDNKSIESAINEMDTSSSSSAMMHKIFYYEVDAGYTRAHLQWGSDYLKDLALAKFSCCISVKLADVLNDLGRCLPGSLKGMLLEPLALQLLSTCQEPFKRQMLAGGPELSKSITFPELSMNRNLNDNEFMNALENKMKGECAENVLLVPSNHSYPAIDAAAVVTREGRRFCFLLQVTINKHHGVTGEKAIARLQEIVSVVGVTNCVFMFVLPDNDVFSVFKAQTLPECNGKTLSQCKIALSNPKKRKHGSSEMPSLEESKL